MEKCPFCNFDIKDNCKFCPNCGADLIEFKEWLAVQSGGKISKVAPKSKKRDGGLPHSVGEIPKDATVPEKTNVSLGEKVTKILLSLFALSVILFFTLIFSFSSSDSYPPESFGNYVTATLLAGALFFIAMVTSTIINGNMTLFGKKRISTSGQRKFIPPKWLEVLPLVLVLIGVIGFLVYRSDMLLKGDANKTKNVNNYKSAATAPEITEKNPGVKVNTTNEVVKKVTQTDQVRCNIHANCGGGSKMMSATECSNITCCNMHEKCGGGSKLVTKKECLEKICCELDGKSSWIGKSECNEKQEELYKDKYGDYLKSVEKDSDYEYVPPTPSAATYPTNVTNNDIQCSYGSIYLGRMSYEKCLDEIKNEKEKLLQKCISDASEAREDAEISWRNTARSYGIISSSEFLVRLNQINSTYESLVNSCKSAYGD